MIQSGLSTTIRIVVESLDWIITKEDKTILSSFWEHLNMVSLRLEGPFWKKSIFLKNDAIFEFFWKKFFL
jgi:hypothetical protein